MYALITITDQLHGDRYVRKFTASLRSTVVTNTPNPSACTSSTSRPRWVRLVAGRSMSTPVARASAATVTTAATATAFHDTERPASTSSVSPNTGTSVRIPPTSEPSDGLPSITTTKA